MKIYKGDKKRFDSNWKTLKEAEYIHWTKKEPKNQIQYAFRNHWNIFKKIIGTKPIKKRVLEVGCGRGSLSAYFSENKWNCELIDVSNKAISLANNSTPSDDPYEELTNSLSSFIHLIKSDSVISAWN